jgi:3D (Asp-Asp-Asp) domain-containing protein
MASCKTLLASLLLLKLCSCAPVALLPSKNKGVARVTFYNAHEDKFGSRIACSKSRRATVGKTAAAESQFPFGTVVRIPWLARILGNGSYIVEDRGSAVQNRKASFGTTPVFDLFVNTRKEMKRLAAIVPPYLPYETN